MARADVAAELVFGGHQPTQCRRPRLLRCSDIAAKVIDHTRFDTRAAFDAALDRRYIKLILICLLRRFHAAADGGFCRSLARPHHQYSPVAFAKYKGLNTHARAIEAGDSEAGCSVHYMRPEMDDGPVIVQRRVPILPDDTPETLAARVLVEEHIAYPEALNMVLKKMAGTA